MPKSKAPSARALENYERARAAGMSMEDAASLLAPTPRPKRVRETEEYLRDLKRLVAAAGRRVADADGPELVQLMALREDLDEAIAVGIQGQKSRGSWAYVASSLGQHRSSVFEKWGPRVRALETVAS